MRIYFRISNLRSSDRPFMRRCRPNMREGSEYLDHLCEGRLTEYAWITAPPHTPLWIARWSRSDLLQGGIPHLRRAKSILFQKHPIKVD